MSVDFFRVHFSWSPINLRNWYNASINMNEFEIKIKTKKQNKMKKKNSNKQKSENMKWKMKNRCIACNSLTVQIIYRSTATTAVHTRTHTNWKKKTWMVFYSRFSSDEKCIVIFSRSRLIAPLSWLCHLLFASIYRFFFSLLFCNFVFHLFGIS